MKYRIVLSIDENKNSFTRVSKPQMSLLENSSSRAFPLRMRVRLFQRFRKFRKIFFRKNFRRSSNRYRYTVRTFLEYQRISTSSSEPHFRVYLGSITRYFPYFRGLEKADAPFHRDFT